MAKREIKSRTIDSCSVELPGAIKRQLQFCHKWKNHERSAVDGMAGVRCKSKDCQEHLDAAIEAFGWAAQEVQDNDCTRMTFHWLGQGYAELQIAKGVAEGDLTIPRKSRRRRSR